jgi:hypothetical protein
MLFSVHIVRVFAEISNAPLWFMGEDITGSSYISCHMVHWVMWKTKRLS